MLKNGKILIVFGTRPEIIKLGPVHNALVRRKPLAVDTFYSGQHIELADGLLDLFSIAPRYQARTVTSQLGLAEKTGQMVVELGSILSRESYDWLVVQGDTASALAGGLAGFLAGVPVAHVEAGLRTNDLSSPWPEEFNRRVITTCTQLHFAPTLAARSNLLAEKVPANRIVVTGNTVIDALAYVSNHITAEYIPHNRELQAIDQTKKLVLVTGHRRENFGAPLKRLIAALIDLAQDGDKVIIFPVHLNPNVQSEVQARLSGVENVHLLDPLRYPDFVFLLSRAWIVVTDSGGIQEEAPSFGLPVVITRTTTERPEVIDSGFGHLVGCTQLSITEAVRRLTHGEKRHVIAKENPFGDGHAAERIAAALVGERRRRDHLRASSRASLAAAAEAAQ